MMMKYFNKGSCAFVLTVVLVLAGTPPAHAAWALNMTPGISAMSRSIYGLHMMMFWWCVAIAIPVFGFMIFSIVRYRHSRGVVADTTLTHSTRAEVIWTVIPVLILIGMTIPAARVLVQTADTTGSQLTIRVTGYQWKWGYEYVASGVEVLSTLDRASNAARQLDSGIDPNTVPNYLLDVDHALVVPAGVKVQLLITAQDVIHSWWMPVLGIKKDAIPGYINEAWFKIDAGKTGIYRGQCAELCGRGHAYMPIVIDVRSKADFDEWIKAQKAAGQANPAIAPAPTPTPSPASSPGVPAAAPGTPTPATPAPSAQPAAAKTAGVRAPATAAPT